MFIPHVPHVAKVKQQAALANLRGSARNCGNSRSGGNWGVAVLIGVAGGALGPVFGALLSGVHGDLAAGLVLVLLGSAGAGFAIGKAVGKQR